MPVCPSPCSCATLLEPPLRLAMLLLPDCSVQKFARSDADIHTAVKAWLESPTHAEATYGHISQWDVSSVTNMSRLFYGAANFNEDLSRWDVSKVTSMHCMFDGAASFNQDLSGWDVSKVETMGSMFCGAESFHQDLTGWDVSAVWDRYAMLQNTSKYMVELHRRKWPETGDLLRLTV